MLVLFPILLLLAGGVLLLILGRTRSSVGTIWLIAAALALSVWLLMIFLKFRLPISFTVGQWLPGGLSQDRLVFSITPTLWVLGFSLVALLVCVVFTEAVRLETSRNLLILTGSFLLTGVALLSVFSTSPLAYVLNWSVLDLLELAILITVISNAALNQKAIVSFAFRIFGTIMVVAGLVAVSSSGGSQEFSQASGNLFIFYILGAGFRLGVLPLHLPFASEDPVRRSLGTILRIASPISTIAFLSQLPAASTLSGWTLFVFILSLSAALFGAVGWLLAKDELRGRQFWTLSLSGLAMIAAMRGQTAGVVTLGVIMPVAGGFLFTQQYRGKWFSLLNFILMLGLFGLPFTYSAGVWLNAGTAPWPWMNVIFLFSLSVLLAGMVRFLLRSNEAASHNERWMEVFHQAGLIILIVSPWTMLIGNPGLLSLYPGWIWSAIFLVIAAAGSVALFIISRRPHPKTSPIGFTLSLLNQSNQFLTRLFNLEWLTDFIRWLFKVLSKGIQLLNAVLEGEGGVLWALLFLALLASLLSTVG